LRHFIAAYGSPRPKGIAFPRRRNRVIYTYFHIAIAKNIKKHG
jgi:hypothetical protein